MIKVRLQLERKKGGGREYQGFLRGSAHLIRTEGILSLGKGLDAAVLRALLYGSVRIGYDFFTCMLLIFVVYMITLPKSFKSKDFMSRYVT